MQSMKMIVFTLVFLSLPLSAAQQNCLSNEQSHFEADMPAESYEWFFAVVDDQHTEASLTFPAMINRSRFFQVLARKQDETDYEFAFALEALDHPLTTDAKQIEFVIANDALSELVIEIHYLDPGLADCNNTTSYSYFVRAQ